ncbi:uncharacterized protein CMU_040370 [Cryptosporidium muris RN66]|uniref:Uncharacterized protein n=1 Tax=Cryptosporidium muris (strain RN66) TaxID=441375 RepID=B6A9S7_CRYMR|nr:uncharacterized protein CMU_040370 [Cryptosporidium muris RN66]EEA04968.1 hypothetical protein CMU_040370 [Cryptosporidium muris RN66]|eukprot:XP_002139317.1 hypothetical protein [Cryptosporidium muris RN66]
MIINYKLVVQLLVILQSFLWGTFAVRLRAKESKVLRRKFSGSNYGNLQTESIAKNFILTPIDNLFGQKGLYNNDTESVVKSKDSVEPTTEFTVDSKLESTGESKINSTLDPTEEPEISSIFESERPRVNSILESMEEPEINSILESERPGINSTLEYMKEPEINSILKSERSGVNSTLEPMEEIEINSILKSERFEVNSTLESIEEPEINSILESERSGVNSTLESIEEPEINSILESERSGVNSTLESIEEPEINSILESERSGVNSTLESIEEPEINSILESERPRINSTLESIEEPEINSILESERSGVNSTLESIEEPEINSILESERPRINSTLESIEEPKINSILESERSGMNSTLEPMEETEINSILESERPGINSTLEYMKEPEINSILESERSGMNSTLESMEETEINSILESKGPGINSTLKSIEEPAIDYTRNLFEVKNDTEGVSAEPNLVELEHKAQHNEASDSKEEEKELGIKQKGDESYNKQIEPMINKFEKLVPVYFNSSNVSKARNESLISSYNNNSLSINASKPSSITLDKPKYIRRILKYDMKEPEMVDFMEGIFPEVIVTNVDNSKEKKEFNEGSIQDDTLEDILIDKPKSITDETVRTQPSPEFEGEEKIVEFLNRVAIEDASEGANQQSAEVTETLPQNIYGGQYVLVEFNNFEPNYISSEQLKILELKLKTAPEGSHIIVKNTFEPQLFEYYQNSIKELDQDLQMKILKLIDEDKAARTKDLKSLKSETDNNEIKEDQREVFKIPEESPEVILEQGSSSIEFEDITADDTEDEIEDEIIEN